MIKSTISTDPVKPPELREQIWNTNELEYNWIEFNRAFQFNPHPSDDLFTHICILCRLKVEITGSAIRNAKRTTSRLILPCGHTTSALIKMAIDGELKLSVS